MSLLERILNNLLARLFLIVSVATVGSSWLLANQTDQQTLLHGLASNTEAILVADGHHLIVHFDQIDRQNRHKLIHQRQEAARADSSHRVYHGTVALGGRVKLDALDVEAFVELLPDVGSQAVAHGASNRVRAIQRRRRLIDQEATQLAHVHKRGAVVLDALLPEARGAEFLAQDDGGAVHDGRSHADDLSVAVVDGQSDHDHVVRGEARRVEEARRTAQVARVLDDRWLGQTGRTARVNVQQSI